MKTIRQIKISILVLVGLYLLLPLVIFDFSSNAVPNDEDTFGTQQVAIGSRPWHWVPYAAHSYDFPGGYDYDPSGWPFVVWKPMCVIFVKIKGYALPAEWR